MARLLFFVGIVPVLLGEFATFFLQRANVSDITTLVHSMMLHTETDLNKGQHKLEHQVKAKLKNKCMDFTNL